MVRRADIAAAARSYLGAPYRHQGRLRSGIDCIGLIVAVARDLGLLPDGFVEPVYGRAPDGRLVPMLAAHMVPVRTIATGTVVLFEIRNRERHVGIMADAGAGRFVHANNLVGLVVETVRSSAVSRHDYRLARAFDFPGVID